MSKLQKHHNSIFNSLSHNCANCGSKPVALKADLGGQKYYFAECPKGHGVVVTNSPDGTELASRWNKL